MKRIGLIFGAFIACIGPLRPAFADPILDQIDAAFVGHAKLGTEFTTRGETQLEYLDNVIEIGSLKGSPLAGLDGGVLGTILPDSNQLAAAQWTAGAKIHFAPILKTYIVLPPEWQFLNTVEVDGRYSYNFTAHHGVLGISIVYPFK